MSTKPESPTAAFLDWGVLLVEAPDENEHAEYWLGLKAGHEGRAWNEAASHDWKIGFSSAQDDVAQADAIMARTNVAPRT